MQLESSVLSDERIRKLAKDFICVKIDPRDRKAFQAAAEYKLTRYVPEVVFVGPDGEVLERLEKRSVEGVAAAMEWVLDTVRKLQRR